MRPSLWRTLAEAALLLADLYLLAVVESFPDLARVVVRRAAHREAA